jgi:hypothetical protein
MPLISSGFLSRYTSMPTRHRFSSVPVTHPQGVIVPGDAFMTKKLHEPGYAPYCLKHTKCGRVQRTDFGFECPSCGNRMNFDLSHYNGNVDVQYEPAPETASSEVSQ